MVCCKVRLLACPVCSGGRNWGPAPSPQLGGDCLTLLCRAPSCSGPLQDTVSPGQQLEVVLRAELPSQCREGRKARAVQHCLNGEILHIFEMNGREEAGKSPPLFLGLPLGLSPDYTILQSLCQKTKLQNSPESPGTLQNPLPSSLS